MPVALVPAATAGWLNAAGSVPALTVVLAVLAAPIAARHGRGLRLVLVAAVPLALCTEPVRQTLGFGQVNLWLFALVLLDLVVLGRTGSRWAGAGVGIATAIKLTPGLFIVYLLVTGQWRAARTATVTTAALTGGAFLLAPADVVALLRRPAVADGPDGHRGRADQPVPDRPAGPPGRDAGRTGRLVGPALRAGPGGGPAPGPAGVRGRRHRDGADPDRPHRQPGQPHVWTHHLVFLPVAVLVPADVAARRRDPCRRWPRSPSTPSASSPRSGSSRTTAAACGRSSCATPSRCCCWRW
jgi:alpha-1,2-mannosyltransferase